MAPERRLSPEESSTREASTPDNQPDISMAAYRIRSVWKATNPLVCFLRGRNILLRPGTGQDSVNWFCGSRSSALQNNRSLMRKEEAGCQERTAGHQCACLRTGF